MASLRNRVGYETVTTGTGTITLGSSIAQYFALVVGDNAEEFDYVLIDADATDVEMGRGTYTHSGTTFTRDSVERSTNGDAKIVLSSGTHSLYLTPTAKSLDRMELQLVANTITTTDLTCVVNTTHSSTITGMTANRNAKIPAGVAGDRIKIPVVDSSASYWFIVIGDTGIAINGGTAATEATRMNKAGDFVELVATSTSNWSMWPAPPWPAG